MNRAGDPRNLTNRPGLSALSYRIGDYASFRNNLLAQLSKCLPSLKTRDSNDPAIALLDAWAVVEDVLTFYQERIANEGYLMTAAERQSIIELGRLIGYELKPGVSASTHLAFTLEEKPGEPLQVVLPQGTQAMSIPAEGEKPQLFETSEDLLVSPLWNALTPRLSKPQIITQNTRYLYLQGASIQLKAGDFALLAGIQDQVEATFLLKLATVEPIQELGTTLITWDYNLEKLGPKGVLRNPQLFAFRLRAGLFGNTAPRWEAIPDDLKQQSPEVKLKGGVFKAFKPAATEAEDIKWEANKDGLPSQDILCLAARQTFYFAGTEDTGIFRWNSVDEANPNWRAINNGLTNLSVQTLYVMDEARGYLLAGTPIGGVFRSKDNGETWSPIGTGSTRLHPETSNTVNPVNTGIPNVVVRSLLTYTKKDKSYIFAGTDDDIYRTENQGQDWSSSKIPNQTSSSEAPYEHLSGLPDRVIHSLLHTLSISGQITGVDTGNKTVTVKNVTGTLQKDDLFVVGGQEYSVKTSVETAKLKLAESFSSDVSGKTFQFSESMTGIIDSVNEQQIDVSTLSGSLRKDDDITVENILVGEEEVDEERKVEEILEYTVELNEEVDTISVDSTFNAGTNIKLFAGTDKGIHLSIDNGNCWLDQTQSDAESKLIDKVIYSLILYANENTNYVLAGTSEGIWISEVRPEPLSWTRIDKLGTLSNPSVRSLRILESSTDTTYVFACTDEGVFRGKLNGDWLWDKTEDNSVLKGITSIAISSENSDLVLAGTKFSGFTEEITTTGGESNNLETAQTEWPGFYIQNNQIDLDALYPKILEDSWVVLLNQNQESQSQGQILSDHFPVQVDQVFAEQRQGFTLDSKITRLIPDRTVQQPKAFNPRSTLVLAQSESLSLAGISLTVKVQQANVFQDSLWDNKIFLSEYVHGLEVNKTVIISGQHIRAKVNAGGVFRSRNWRFLSPDLGAENIRALVLRESDGNLFVITNTGVWRSQDDGQHWGMFSRGELDSFEDGIEHKADISSIAIFRGRIQAGVSSRADTVQARPITTSALQNTQQQIFGISIKKGDIFNVLSRTFTRLFGLTRLVKGLEEENPKNFKLDTGFGIDLDPGTASEVNRLLVGTDKGVYRLEENKELALSKWKLIEHDLSENLKGVQVLLVIPRDAEEAASEDSGFDKVVAGTKQNGVFISNDGGDTWDPSPLPSKEENVTTLAANAAGDIFAGTEKHGIFRLPNQESISDGEGDWEPIYTVRTDLHIVSLVVYSTEEKDYLFAGTATSGVFQKIIEKRTTVDGPEVEDNSDPTEEEKSWKSVNTNLADLRILTLFLDIQKRYLIVSTKEKGIFRVSLPPSKTPIWESISVGIDDRRVQDFTFDAQEHLLAGTSTGVFQSLNPERSLSELYWQHSNQGLTYNYVQALIPVYSEEKLCLFAGTRSGIFRSLNQGLTWELMIQGLRNTEIQALLSDDAMAKIFTGTKEGLFSSADRGKTWHSVNLGRVRPNVQALAIHGANPSYLFAGTLNTGIFRSADGGRNWFGVDLTRQDIRVLLSRPPEQDILAGTAGDGVWRSRNNGDTWTNWTNTRSASGKISSNGVTITGNNTQFQSELQLGDRIEAEGQIRTVVSISSEKEQLTVDSAFIPAIQSQYFIVYTGLDNLYITAMQPYTQRLSGTISSNGASVTGEGTEFTAELHPGDSIIVLLKDGEEARKVDKIESATSLLLDKAFSDDLSSGTSFKLSSLLVGTAGSGIFHSFSEGHRWEVVNQGLKDLEIRCLTFDPDTERFYVGAATGGVFHLRKFYDLQLLSLDSVNGLPTEGKDLVVAAKIGGSYHARVFDRAGTRVIDQGQDESFPDELLVEQLESAFESPSINNQTERELVQKITSSLGHSLVKRSDRWVWEPINAGLTNTDVRAILIEDSNLYLGGIGTLFSLDGLDFVELQPDDLLRVVDAPTDIELTDGQTAIDLAIGETAIDLTNGQKAQEWRVLDRDNFKGKLIITQADDITLYPASEDDPAVSELAVIHSPPDDEDQPVLTLAESLQQSYDPVTVKVYANVAEATHGETISEILGSGEGTVINQSFTLSKPPLTHVAAPVPSGGESALKVYVNEVEWTRVSSLYPLDKQDRNYILRIEDDGTTTITFGDGQRGARLPSGEENITAAYRSGIGVEGNVGTEQIALKKTGPPSLQEVINPEPATGGANPESLESARTSIPATTRTLERIISLQDFEDFAQVFAGIGKAQAATLWAGGSQLVHITVAAEGGEPVLSDSGLYNNLVNGVNAARDLSQQVQIASFEPIFFIVEARVMHRPEYQADKVEIAIRQSLLKTFAFEPRSFGQAVTQSEVIAAIQSIPGVLAVDLDFLHRRQASRTLQSSLTAKNAFWDSETNQIRPAQLLMLWANGIRLNMVQML